MITTASVEPTVAPEPRQPRPRPSSGAAAPSRSAGSLADGTVASLGMDGMDALDFARKWKTFPE
jgi:hypothetical protein